MEQARVVADRENRPEPELIAEMQGACAKRLEAWRSSRKWKPGEAALLDEALEAIAKVVPRGHPSFFPFPSCLHRLL